MTCSYCGGQTEEQRVRFCVCDHTPPIIIENVPAFVCIQCGDKSFSEATITVFENVRDGLVSPVRTETVQVYEYNTAERSPAGPGKDSGAAKPRKAFG